MVILIVILACMLYYIPYFINANYEYENLKNDSNESNTSPISCSIMNDEVNMFWMDIISTTILPFCLMLFFSLVTIVNLCKSRHRIRRVSLSNRKLSLKTKDIKFSIISILLNVTFLSVNLPLTIFNLYTSYVDIDSDLYDFLYVLLMNIFYSYFATNFFLNLIFNSIFRDEFLNMFSEIKSNLFINFFLQKLKIIFR